MAPAVSKPGRNTSATQDCMLPFKVTKSNPKPSVPRAARKLRKALQQPACPPGNRYSINVLPDGLLNVEKVPDYLKAAVKRNANESLLLRLPDSIKSKIWVYAMGGLTIDIRVRDAKISNEASSTISDTALSYVGKVMHSSPRRKKVRTAFHLPEVCRQIYAETATLTYSLNRFSFTGEVEVRYGRDNGPDGALEGWTRDCLPAQRKAIVEVRPHWHDLQDYLDGANMRAFKQLFPSLKRLRVASRAVNCEAKWPSRGSPIRKRLREQAKETIAVAIKKQEGEDVDAVFV